MTFSAIFWIYENLPGVKQKHTFHHDLGMMMLTIVVQCVTMLTLLVSTSEADGEPSGICSYTRVLDSENKVRRDLHRIKSHCVSMGIKTFDLMIELDEKSSDHCSSSTVHHVVSYQRHSQSFLWNLFPSQSLTLFYLIKQRPYFSV